MPTLLHIVVLALLMVFVCPFCKSDNFQSTRGLAVHRGSCLKAQEKLRQGIFSRKRKQEDDGGQDKPVESRFPHQSHPTPGSSPSCAKPDGPDAPINNQALGQNEDIDMASEVICVNQCIQKNCYSHIINDIIRKTVLGLDTKPSKSPNLYY